MRPKFLSMVLIIGLGILVYSNTFLCPFQFDDLSSITDNSFIKDIHHLYKIWDFLPRRFILYLSLTVNYHFNGLHVLGYHVFNLAVHLISSILVWWLVLLITNEELIALFAGLIFVSHPIQTEAVTYIVQRAASMATMFYLASMCLYIQSHVIASRAKQSFYYTSSLLMAILAMFTKEIAITLPLMIVLYEYCFLKNQGKVNWKRLTPFLLTIGIIPVTMLLTESAKAQAMRGVAAEDPAGISTWHYLLTECRVMVTYIRLLFIPINQNLDYDYPIFKSILEWPVLFSFLFLTSILVWAKRLFPKHRLLSFSIFWFFMTLLPESSLKPIKDVIAEHRLYLPMVGYSIFLASGMYYLSVIASEAKQSNKIATSPTAPRNDTIFYIPLTAILICNSLLTYQRNSVWKDEITLLNDTIQKSPHKERPYNNRGLVLSNEGKIPEAIADFTKAIEINPFYTNAYINRGFMYYKEGDFNQAVSDDTRAIETNPNLAIAYINRGNAYLKQNNLEETVSDYNKAIALKANYADIYFNLGFIYYKQGNFAQALVNFNRVLKINPQDNEALHNRNISYYQMGKQIIRQ